MTAGAGSRLVALVNPAWKSPSDFGLFKAGEAKKALSEFEVTYSLQSLVVYGYTVREKLKIGNFYGRAWGDLFGAGDVGWELGLGALEGGLTTHINACTILRLLNNISPLNIRGYTRILFLSLS